MTGSTQSQLILESAPWSPQEGPEAFLELWGINPSDKWPSLFCALVRLGAYIDGLHGVVPTSKPRCSPSGEKLVLSHAKVSPVIFWSRLKASLAPIFQADDQTLAALGLNLYSRTVPALALALSHALADLPLADQEAELLSRYGRW